MQSAKGASVLDLGCGSCYHTVRLARSDLAITGVDFSEVALARARETLRDAGIEGRVRLQQGDATELPFADASFHNVLLWGVLMHIPEAEKALAEAARVLKPGGKLLLSENNARSLEVVFLEPTINLVKRLVGRKPHPRKRTKLGIEEWQAAESDGLLARKTDIPALVDVCRRLGLKLEKRFAGQFTEAFVRTHSKRIKDAIHAFNRFYFEHVGRPGLSLSNIVVFRKNPDARDALAMACPATGKLLGPPTGIEREPNSPGVAGPDGFK